MKCQGHYHLHLKQCVCDSHTSFLSLTTILYIFHMKTTGRQETNDGNRANIWSSQSEAMDLYLCAWNVWSYLLLPTLQIESKVTLKPSFSSGDGLQVLLLAIRGAPGEMFMRACFVQLLLVAKTLEIEVSFRKTNCGWTCQYLFNRRTQFFTKTWACSSCLDRVIFFFLFLKSISFCYERYIISLCYPADIKQNESNSLLGKESFEEGLTTCPSRAMPCLEICWSLPTDCQPHGEWIHSVAGNWSEQLLRSCGSLRLKSESIHTKLRYI